MARAFNGVGGYIRFKSTLDPRLRELAILQVGWLEKSEYEFTHHVIIGKEFGVTDRDIQSLIAETEGRPSEPEPLVRAIALEKGRRHLLGPNRSKEHFPAFQFREGRPYPTVKKALAPDTPPCRRRVGAAG